jgi:YD repeat-containing protein
MSVRDANNKATYKIFSASGAVRRLTDHDYNSKEFDYDAFGNPRRIIDQNNNVLQSSSYNLRGMLTQRTDMDMGAWNFTPNALGQVVSQTDAKSQNVTLAFDLLGRLTGRTEAEGTSTWKWGDSSASKNIGQLEWVQGSDGYKETYAYDSIGRPRTTTILADVSYQIDYSYNNIGALDTLTYPQSTSSYRLKVQYEYLRGQLRGIKDFNAPSTVFWTSNAINARDQLTQETLGNGLVANRAFDSVSGTLKSIQTGLGGGTSVQNLTYEWGSVGNLRKRKDLNQSNLTEEFFYGIPPLLLTPS